MRAIHNWVNRQDDGAKKDMMGLGKSMNGADLPVLLLEVNGANPVFLSRKKQYCPIYFLMLVVYYKVK